MGSICINKNGGNIVIKLLTLAPFDEYKKDSVLPMIPLEFFEKSNKYTINAIYTWQTENIDLDEAIKNEHKISYINQDDSEEESIKSVVNDDEEEEDEDDDMDDEDDMDNQYDNNKTYIKRSPRS